MRKRATGQASGDDFSHPEELLRFLRPAIAEDLPQLLRAQVRLCGEVDEAGRQVVAVQLGEGTRWLDARQPQDMLVQVASAVQDFVCDETGAPWPEVVTPDGAFVVVLEPALVAGKARWAAASISVAIGALAADLANVGLRLR